MPPKPKAPPSKAALRAAHKVYRCGMDKLSDAELKTMGFSMKYCRPDAAFVSERAYELLADAFCAGMSVRDIE